MNDRLLIALERAEKVWRAAQYFSNKEKFVEAEELHAMGVFSLNQLAKICRTNVPYLTRRKLPKMHVKGGRFEPEALGALVQIRQMVLLGQYVPDSLFRVAVNAGCSLNCVGTLTGAPVQRLYHRERMLQAKVEDYARHTSEWKGNQWQSST